MRSLVLVHSVDEMLDRLVRAALWASRSLVSFHRPRRDALTVAWTVVIKRLTHRYAFTVLTCVTRFGAVLPLASSAAGTLLASAAIFGSAFAVVATAMAAFVRRNLPAHNGAALASSRMRRTSFQRVQAAIALLAFAAGLGSMQRSASPLQTQLEPSGLLEDPALHTRLDPLTSQLPKIRPIGTFDRYLTPRFNARCSSPSERTGSAVLAAAPQLSTTVRHCIPLDLQ